MKTQFSFALLSVGLLLWLSAGPSYAGKLDSKCSYKGKNLWGKVQIVDSFPDIKVQVVSSFPDLKVQKVKSFPDSCGKWQIVRAFPDIKVQIVKAFPDIKVEYVSSFPGVP